MQTGSPGWPERVKLMQEHWLGRSEGIRFAFLHDVHDEHGALMGGGRLWVFTTRADTIMGVTFCAVAPEHALALRAAEKSPAVAAFLASCKTGGTTEAEIATQAKRGIDTGLFVQHPLSHEQIPLWVGNYVLMHYGDGAVMGVPAHDERDFAFAKQYGIDLLRFVHVDGEEFSYDEWQDWYADTACSVTINSDVYSGLAYEVAVDDGRRGAGHRGLGGKQTTWRLRDWGISRAALPGNADPDRPLRRKWAGVCRPRCGVVPVSEKDLPVVLPEDLDPRRLRQPARRAQRVPRRRLSDLRQGRSARDRHDGHLRRQRLVLHALLRPAARRRHGRRGRHSGRRWTSTSAASSTRPWTCSTRASGPRSCAT